MPVSNSEPRTPEQAGLGAKSATARGPPHAATDFLVVGVGASAGGLEACKKLFAALPADSGMAFILVQHLDPTHESMMVDLLAASTSMTVRQAADGDRIEADHLYIIPPGTYLSVADGALHLSEPNARHGARLPFDFLLHAMAEDYGRRSIAVVLSGTGSDGSLGLKSIREKCGLVIAQDPGEAGFDGMPRNAIQTGCVDLVLTIAGIAAALVSYRRRMTAACALDDSQGSDAPASWLPEIVDLLRARTRHDFTLYKPGTLRRRIERRMALATIELTDANRYIEMLQSDAAELDLLAKDLLINVTSFFRDPKIFERLAETVVPALVQDASADQSVRIWIAGCSTGEEAYSLVMLFCEYLIEHKSSVRLHVFASDVDPEAVAVARTGLYPETIAADVSPARLARFFSKEEHGYRVLPELRSAVVFSVQDLLADPPFSRLNMISCRNLLIYLGQEAQSKVISLFHFALSPGGVLLLGSSETAGNIDGRFEIISKPDRLYRQIGRSRAGPLGFPLKPVEAGRVLSRLGPDASGLRPSALADLCRRMVMESYAPAALLINSRHECLYSLGPTGRYLRLPPGYPTFDLIAMAPYELRAKLKLAIHEAAIGKSRVEIPGGRVSRNGQDVAFAVHVLPVAGDGEQLLLVCFVENETQDRNRALPGTSGDNPRVAELEDEIETLKSELKSAVRGLELAGEEQKIIDEEVSSVNEEFQSTNEELLTSKEELQSLNEELTALNSQLQETLERQRTTSDDLQNILYSTDVATLFLDTRLNIRFFTPATKLLFSVIPSDIGRPLADLSSLASDETLLADSQTVLHDHAALEREIEAQAGTWYIRRILPYRVQNNRVEGVVITFTDITDRKRTARALEAAKHEAELATIAKSRFLAVASHDLRQPLQTLALLQGLLAKRVDGEKTVQLVARLGETLAAMSGMLNTLLDINQIEAGTVRPAPVDFPINDLLMPLRDEFGYHAQAQKLGLRVVPCGLTVRSDPRLLEQMIRNLLTNALKHTERGRIVLGCRRHGDVLSIETWDTGVGIPASEHEAIFDEYHQVDNFTRQRTRGLGLGLSIVRRLGQLLSHDVRVQSEPGKGSVFTIDVPIRRAPALVRKAAGLAGQPPSPARRSGTVLIVEDDGEVRALLEECLGAEGHDTVMALDGVAALALLKPGTIPPDLVLADYNLPNGMNGLQLAVELRARMSRDIPVIILTGDITSSTLRSIAGENCVQLHKPVKLTELTQAVHRLLPENAATRHVAAGSVAGYVTASPGPVVFVVDDDSNIRMAVRAVLEANGQAVEDFSSCEAFLAAYRPGREACLLVDAYLPGMTGLELLRRLRDLGHHLPAIMITGSSDVQIAVQAMKAGAFDFIEKPISTEGLAESVDRALMQSRDANKRHVWREAAAAHVSCLTPRQHQIMALVLAGHPSKNIAADLGISQRTVENHRASIMKKTGAKSLPALARLALAASNSDGGDVITHGRPTMASAAPAR